MRDRLWMSDPKELPKKGENPPADIPVIFLGGAEDGGADDSVEVAQNKIFFYSDVSRAEILKLNKHLDAVEKKVLTNSVLLNCAPTNIYLHVNSFGGSLFAGLAAVDYIKKCSVPVHTIIDGCAASAATLMTCVGAHRQIHRHSFMLIHQLSTAMWGKY